MTDNEIIKALECCSEIDRKFCDNCTYNREEDCIISLTRDALSLIKRQKAEIERLQQKYELSEAEREANVKGFTESLEKVKAEAVKEFAERAKSTMFNEDFLLCEPCDMANIIDNLVKEMTEDEGK